MRRAIAVLALSWLASAPAGADDWGVSLRLGGFFPRADSNLFAEDTTLYRVGKEDFRGPTGGIEFSAKLARNLELGVEVDGYGRDIDTSYRDYTRDDGGEIFQTLRLSFVPIGASIRLVPTSRHMPVVPYVAVGGDAIIWRYEEEGDFVDRWDTSQPGSYPIIADHFIADGVVFGAHAAAGLRVYVNDDFAILGEVRYLWTERRDMKDDFENLSIDASGLSATVGIHVRF